MNREEALTKRIQDLERALREIALMLDVDTSVPLIKRAIASLQNDRSALMIKVTRLQRRKRTLLEILHLR